MGKWLQTVKQCVTGSIPDWLFIFGQLKFLCKQFSFCDVPLYKQLQHHWYTLCSILINFCYLYVTIQIKNKLPSLKMPASQFHWLVFGNVIFMFMALVDNQLEIDCTSGLFRLLYEPQLENCYCCSNQVAMYSGHSCSSSDDLM